jgi:hypothetical protein
VIAIEIEHAIVERLSDKLGSLTVAPKVYPGADLENIADKSQSAAAVFVAYNGIVGVEPMANVPGVAKIKVEFLIWVVTRSAKNHGSQQGTRETADPIVDAVLEWLSGWKPAQNIPALVPGESPGQVYRNGFGYFPLTFTTTRQVRGKPNE